MSEAFRIKILAADKTFYDGLAISLTVPAFDGSFQVLAHHEPVVMALKEGVIKFVVMDENAKEQEIRGVNGIGVVKVDRDLVTILVDTIEAPDEIDRARAERALHRAMEQLRQDQSIQEYEMTKASLARAMLRLSESSKLSDTGE